MQRAHEKDKPEAKIFSFHNGVARGSLRSTFASRLSSLKDHEERNELNDHKHVAVCKPSATSLADGESSSSCNMSTYCARRTDAGIASDVES